MHVVLRADEPSWAAALGALPVACRDVYFSSEYHALHADGETAPACAVVREGDAQLIIPGLAHAVPGQAGRSDLQTCNGYGGPLATPDAGRAFLEAAWQGWRQEAARAGVVAAFFRLHPMLENHRWLPSDATIVDDRQTVLVPLQDGVPAALAAADSRFRNKVNKSKKAGLAVTWNDAADWDAYPALYAAAMERLGASDALRFPPAYFDRLRAMRSAELAAVRDADGVLAAAVFLAGPEWWHYHLGARRPSGENQAMSYLFYRAMERAAAAGAAGLHLGGGATPAPDDSLLRFKRLFAPRALTFRVARVIVDPAEYERLAGAAERRRGRPARWLLGYREP